MLVDYTYYSTVYIGEEISEGDFPRFEARAERIIKQLVRGRADNLSALPAVQQQAVKDAICAQIEYYLQFGLDVAIAGITGESFTVGNVTVNRGSRLPTGACSICSPASYAILEREGLLYRGVGVL